jgi:hypothetical protein
MRPRPVIRELLLAEAACTVHCILHCTVLSTVHTALHCTVYTAHCTALYYAVHTVLYCTVLYTVHSVATAGGFSTDSVSQLPSAARSIYKRRHDAGRIHIHL